MRDTTTIRLLHGLGGIEFGASAADVEAYLGRPEAVVRDARGIDSWSYRDRLALEAELWPDEGGALRLNGFSTSDCDARLDGIRVVDATLREAVSGLESLVLCRTGGYFWGDEYGVEMFTRGLMLSVYCDQVTETTWHGDMKLPRALCPVCRCDLWTSPSGVCRGCGTEGVRNE